MNPPLKIMCERCSSEAVAVMHQYVDPTGERIEWPKAEVKSDGIYFSIDCPQCGIREQCMAKPSDAD
jgi:hypothetical protein